MRVKLKFFVPEIFVGILMAALVFAMGMLAGSSRHQPSNAQTASNAYQVEAKQKPEPFSVHWFIEDPVAFFTAVLVLAVGVQAGLLVWQLILIRRTMEEASIATKAARRTANASIAQAKIARDAQVNLQRPYIFVFDVHRLHQDGKNDWYVEYTVANYGSIPAIVGEVLVGFETSDKVEPALPTRVSDDHGLATSPILTAGERRLPMREYLPSGMIADDIIVDISEDSAGFITPKFDLLPNYELYFRVIIRYRGPFTRGHETSAMWRVREGLGDLVPSGGEDYNYTR